MDINLSLGIQTKVDAINHCLEAIGSVGINSEEEIDWNIDAASADQLIDNYSQRFQALQTEGWWFNLEDFHKFAPDSVTGNVVVPSNTIAAYIKRYRGKVHPVSLRGNLLFDGKALGYDMSPYVQQDGYVHCRLTVTLAFEHLPTSVKHAVAAACAFWMVNNKEGDPAKMQAYQADQERAFITVQREDARQRRRNVLDGKLNATNVGMSGGFFNNVR